MKKDRLENWFSAPNVSEYTPRSFIDDLGELSDKEKTKPLDDVRKLREFASEIDVFLLTLPPQEDGDKEVVCKSVAKDKLLLLGKDVKNHFELEVFIPYEERAEIFISAGSEQLFLGVSSGSKRVVYKFDPHVRFLTAHFEYDDEGVWKVGEEKFVDDYSDPMKVLEFFQNQED
jgi:hypothetical protein